MMYVNRSQAMKMTGLSYLGDTNVSPKIAKNLKVYNTETFGLYLAPYNLSGYNTCKFSTPECRRGCLFSSGQGRMNYERTSKPRIAKTRLFYEDQNFFMAWLIDEIKAAKNLAKLKNHLFSVRLNCTSDINWLNTYYNSKNIFQIFPDVDFYDYTKDPARFNNLPQNYHLTFSYTGRNKDFCLDLLSKGYNIAVVFNTKQLPEMLWDYPVVDGDISDLRVKDQKGVIVGLKFKQIKDRQAENEVRNSVFCIQPNEIETYAIA